jgi:hypothetical protein
MKYQVINDIVYAGEYVEKNREFDVLSFFEGLYCPMVKIDLKEFPCMPMDILNKNCKIVKI